MDECEAGPPRLTHPRSSTAQPLEEFQPYPPEPVKITV
jgi:hypothetical protein